MDPTLDPTLPVVERGEDVRDIPMVPTAPNGQVLVPDLDALVCRSIGPMCLASIHTDDAICRPDDACWTFEGPLAPELEHVSHGGPCWHEVTARGVVQTVIAVPSDVEAPDEGEPGEAPDPSPVLVEYHEPVGDMSIETMIADLYAKLREEGNPPQLSIMLATLYAVLVPAQIPETMAMLRSVGDSISGVIGDGGSGGIMGKILGRAMKGNAG